MTCIYLQQNSNDFNLCLFEGGDEEKSCEKDLRKTYGNGDAEVHALDGVDFKVEEGEFVSIVGTSGSGKSTLLNMLGGLDRPTSGSVTVDGKMIFDLKEWGDRREKNTQMN